MSTSELLITVKNINLGLLGAMKMTSYDQRRNEILIVVTFVQRCFITLRYIRNWLS